MLGVLESSEVAAALDAPHDFSLWADLLRDEPVTFTTLREFFEWLPPDRRLFLDFQPDEAKGRPARRYFLRSYEFEFEVPRCLFEHFEVRAGV